MLLLISERPDISSLLTRSLSQHGVYFFRATLDNAAYLAGKKDIGGVILDCLPRTSRAEELALVLRRDYPDLPIAVIHSSPEGAALSVERIWTDDVPEMLSEEAWDFCLSCGWWTEPLSVYALTVGNTPGEVYYMGYPLHLTPQEHCLLRCLFYRAPHITSAADLAELCFPERPLPLSTVISLISRINRRAHMISPLPLVENIRGKGYRLRRGLED